MSDSGDFKAPALPSIAKENITNPIVEKKEADEAGSAKKKEERLPSAQNKTIVAPPLDYQAPPFATDPEADASYNLEVLKDGAIVDTIDLSKRKNPTFVTIGRLPECDIFLEHPSISRYHAILQFGKDRMGKSRPGWYVFDLGSTHGSKLNKNTLPAKQYQRVQIGMVLKFGGSSRIFNLIGPPEDADAEWDCSPTEMKERMHKRALEVKLAKQAREEFERDQAQQREEEGCGWGMDYEDAGPSGFLLGETAEDEHLMEDREAYYKDAPVKALQKFFEREGFDMEFSWNETGVNSHNHKWICSIELPIEVAGKSSLVASATVTTSKKDAQAQCALEACRILDAHNVLRKSTAQSRIKRKTVAEDDFYEEDDDEYLDRTGQIELQREKRKQWMEVGTGPKSRAVESYESLQKKLAETKIEADVVEKELQKYRAAKQAELQCEDLDEYMRKIDGTSSMDLKTKTEKSLLTQKLVKLRHECQKLEKLVKIAKPTELPTLKKDNGASLAVTGSSQQALFRKMMQMRRAQPGGAEAKNKEEEDKKRKELEEHDGDYNYELKFVGGKEAESVEFAPEADEDDDTVAPFMKEGPQMPPPPSTQEVSEKKTPEKRPAEGDENLPEKKAKAEEEAMDTMEEVVEEEKEEVAGVVKKNRPRHRAERKEKPKEKRIDGGLDLTGEYGTGVENASMTYATWLPPESVESDAQKKLKEKFAGRY